MRKCRLCGKRKPLSEFYENPVYHDGYSTRCKACLRVITREYQRARVSNRYCVVCGKLLTKGQRKYCSLNCIKEKKA